MGDLQNVITVGATRDDPGNKIGVVFDVKKYAIHDGPGIRTTVFLKGCPLSCWWCHNPEGLTMSPEIAYHRERCIRCGECIRTCPEGALTLSSEGVGTDPGKCLHCGMCTEVCPAEARELVGRNLGVEDVLFEIEKDVLFYDESGGGVTFSGGEPLMQPEFLLELLEACGRLAIHRAVDTTGYTNADLLLRIAERTDLFLYDLKFVSSEKHRKYCGVPNGKILSNLKLIASHGSKVNIRIPIIPGINTDDEDIDGMGSFVANLPDVHAVSILPYHRAAKTKYRKIDRVCRSGDLLPPTEHQMKSIAQRLTRFGLNVKIGG